MSTGNTVRVFLVAVTVVLGTALSGAATAKSAYVIANINATPTPIHSYAIGSAPNVLTFQAEQPIPRLAGGAVGIAIDEASKKLFVTYEAIGTIQLLDAITFADLGTTVAPGAGNLAGIVFHQAKKRLYTVDRNTNDLYVYDWNAATNTLTQVIGPGINGVFDLANVSRAFGVALDEINDRLFVADGNSNTVRYYETTAFTETSNITLATHAPISIAVDQTRQFLYTGAAFNGNYDLVKYDLNPGAPMPLETGVNIPSTLGGMGTEGVIGVAVDEDTGNVYATTGFSGDRLLAFDSTLALLQGLTSAQIMAAGGTNWGDPTGLVIPRSAITFGVSASNFKGSGDGGTVSVGPLELLLGLLFLPMVLARRGARRIESSVPAAVPGVGLTLFVSSTRVWQIMTCKKMIVLLVLVCASFLFLGGCASEPYKPWQAGDSWWNEKQQAESAAKAAQAARVQEQQAEAKNAAMEKERQAESAARAAQAARIKEQRAKAVSMAKQRQAEDRWYIGAGIGNADTDASSASYDRKLAGLGYTTVSDMDSADSAWKLFGGYEFTETWAIEGTYVDLGEVTSDTKVNIGPPGWTPQTFVTAAATKHPYSVNGFAITGKGTYPFWNGFAAFAKLGIFFWEADIEVKCFACSPLAKKSDDEDGVDYTAGAGISYEFPNNTGVRIEWERFSTDRDDVDLFSASGLYRF